MQPPELVEKIFQHVEHGSVDLRHQLEVSKIELETEQLETTAMRKRVILMESEFLKLQEESLNERNQFLASSEEFESQIANLQDQLKSINSQLRSSQNDVEALSLQLHHVQEELDSYYLLSCAQSELLDTSEKRQDRALLLLNRK